MTDMFLEVAKSIQDSGMSSKILINASGPWINEVLKKQNMLLCYCTDEIKNKTLFSAWEIRPYPELKLAQIHKLTNKK